MSSSSFRRPDFRLHLSYPEVTLLRSDVPGMVRLAAPDHPGFADDLRRLAGAVDAAHGRLTVILPDREVWRDRRRLATRLPWTRRQEARELAARALHIPAGEVALSMGRRGDDGSTPLAATRRQTLVDVRRMLAAVGLRPEVIRGAGRFDGFSTPPALGSLRWTPAVRGLPARLPRAALAAGGLAAAIAVVAALLAAEQPEPVMSAGPLVHRSVARAPVALAEAPPPAPVAIRQPVAVADAAPPHARPGATAPALAAAAAAPFSVNTRNVDLATGEDGRVVLKLRELPGARGPVAAGPAPLPRPGVAREAVAAPVPQVQERPRARPAGQPVAVAEPVAAVVKRVAAADTEDFGRPEHRPDAAPAVRVASLTPAGAVVGALAATAVAPLARPDGLRAATQAEPPRPAAKPVAPAPLRKAAAPAPQPKLHRGATAGAVAARPPVAKPAAVAALAPQPKIVRITPAPKIARAAAAVKSVPVSKAASPTVKTVRVAAVAPAAAKSTPRTAGLSARQLSLVGVFGSTGAPHALVRLPNGDIERVRAGDRIAGLQVAAVEADGVRVRSGTSETTLRLPD